MKASPIKEEKYTIISKNSCCCYDYAKPTIRFGNYFFKWDKSCPGICTNEINSLKKFIHKTIPYLEPGMNIFNVSYDDIGFKKLLVDKSRLCIAEKHDNKISFVLHIDHEGASVISREERIKIVNDVVVAGDIERVESLPLNNLKSNYNVALLKWTLGELLFDRVKPK